MSGTVIWSSVAGLTFEQAKAVAAAKGGQLFKDSNSGSEIEAAIDSGRGTNSGDEYKRLWVGAELIDGVWQWPDGSLIPTTKFGDESVNHDSDPSNDAGPVLLYSGELRSADETVFNGNGGFVSDGYVMEYQTDRVIGTEERDIVLQAGTASYIDLRGGDDAMVVSGVSALVVDLGSGNDLFEVDVPGTSTRRLTIIDGDGTDVVSGGAGSLIRASLDGDDDYFLVQEATYGAATRDIFGRNNVLSSAEIGADNVNAKQVTLGSGSDDVSGYDILIGGAGNDTLKAYERAEGGIGNDTLISVAGYRADLKGQEGDDTLQFFGDAKASGGIGADVFEFHAAGKVTINDLNTGDHIDLTRLFAGFEGGASEAFDQGYLKSTVSKGYTYIQFDQNGGGDNFTDLITLKGIFADVTDYLII